MCADDGPGLDDPRPRDCPTPKRASRLVHVAMADPSGDQLSHRVRGTRSRTEVLEEKLITTRTMPRLMVGGAILAIVVAACGGGASTAPSTAPSTEPTTGASTEPSADPMAALVAAATAEGKLTTIALPHDWCNYAGVIDGFKAKYPGITVNELAPDAGSGDEIEAIKANQGSTGDAAPDVIDVGLAFGPSAKADGLIQAYKVSTWDTIPDSAKDAEGFWYGDYYGVLSFEVNKSVVANVPADWSDLLKPEYKNQVALAGRPACVEPGHPGRVRVRACQRRHARQRPAGPRLLQGSERQGQLRAHDRSGRDDRRRRHPDHDALDLQRARSSRRGGRHRRDRRPRSRPPAASRASTCRRSAPTRRTRTLPSSGWNTCTATRDRTSGWPGTATRSATRTSLRRTLFRPKRWPSSRTSRARSSRPSISSTPRRTLITERLGCHRRRGRQVAR